MDEWELLDKIGTELTEILKSVPAEGPQFIYSPTHESFSAITNHCINAKKLVNELKGQMIGRNRR